MTTSWRRCVWRAERKCNARAAYDALRERRGERADLEYVSILHLVAATGINQPASFSDPRLAPHFDDQSSLPSRRAALHFTILLAPYSINFSTSLSWTLYKN